MKLSLSNIAFKPDRNHEIFTYMQQKGFEGLEIAPGLLFGASPYNDLVTAKRITDEIKMRYMLDIISMQSIWFGRTESIFSDDDNRKTLLQLTKQAIDLADTISCRTIVFGCPKNRNIRDESDLDIAYHFFEVIGNYAKEHDVVFCIEPNPTIYGTNFLTTTRQALDFVGQLNNDGIALNLDLGTIIANSEAIELSTSDLDLVGHVHISEPMLVPPVKRDEHQKLKDLLQQYRYNRYISLEMASNENADDIYDAAEYMFEVFR
ncbi:MAG: sugar phosphate isomerase/epimerase [Oscillospiraceae bacterium]|nr:sugar phosphate isomerase/epimerase [Oscillospiraceae bacterium]